MMRQPFRISADPLRGACFDPGTLLMIAKVASIGSTVLGTVGAIQQGNAANAAAQYNAAQLEAQGKTEQAVSQREAQEERRQKELKISRARAVGAASGGGLDIPLMGKLEEEGELRALTALWEGDERAAGRRAQAAGARFEGKQAKRAGMIRGAGSLLSGGASFYDKYGT